jgi:hypothetical protein
MNELSMKRFTTMQIHKISNNLICFLLGFLLFGCSNKLEVHTINSSGLELRNISIEYTGGKYVIEQLKPAQKDVRSIEPTSDSHITIRYIYPSTKPVYVSREFGYFEKGYTGYMQIEIKEGGITNFEDHLEFY